MNQWSFQAFRAEAIIGDVYECVVCWLSRPGEVEDNAVRIGSKIEIARDKLRSLIDMDRAGIAGFRADAPRLIPAHQRTTNLLVLSFVSTGYR